jgi:hypothetical protein
VHKALILAVALGVSHDPGGCDTETTGGGVNAPCTRDKDCSTGLSCTSGVCVEPDSGAPPPVDAGTDAAADAGTAGDASHDQ